MKWHCTAGMCNKAVQKSAKPRNNCISVPSAAAVIYFSTAEDLFLKHIYIYTQHQTVTPLGWDKPFPEIVHIKTVVIQLLACQRELKERKNPSLSILLKF